jgi:hypothetical protein
MQLIRLPNITGNGANGQLTVECPIGYKYRSIQLALVAGTCTAAQITQAQLLLNGSAAWDMTGTDLDQLNQVDAFTDFGTSNVLNWPFTFPLLTDDLLADMTALNTGVVSKATGKVIHTMQLRLTIAGATNPQFEAYAYVENSTDEGPGVIRRVHRYQLASVVGEAGYNTLDFGTRADALLRRFSIRQNAGAVSRVRLTMNTREVLNAPTAVLADALRTGGFVPGANFGAVADFAAMARGFIPQQVPYLDTLGEGNRSLTLYVTNTVAGTNTILMDSIGEV